MCDCICISYIYNYIYMYCVYNNDVKKNLYIICMYMCTQQQPLFDTCEKERRLKGSPMVQTSLFADVVVFQHSNKHCFWCWPRFPTLSFCDLFEYCINIPICMYILLQVAICSHFCNLSNPPKTTQHWWMEALLQIPPNRYKWLARGSQALNLWNTLQLACQGLQTSCSSWWSSHPRIWTHQKPNQKQNPSIGNMGVS